MISAGLVNALYAWAKDSSETQPSEDRIAALKTERDATVTQILSGGKDRRALQTATINGKTFGALITLSVEDKLTVLNQVLVALGEADAGLPSVTYGNFSGIAR